MTELSSEAAVMTLTAFREKVEAVLEADRQDRDPETAHWEQDVLYVSALRATAAGDPDAAEMAREALRLADNDNGTRWYA